MKEATKIAHWPGQDVPCCDEHARKLQAVGAAMGSPVSVSDISISDTDKQGLVCGNCKVGELE